MKSTAGKYHDVFLHRFVYFWHHGEFDYKLTVNHINGIKTDNRIDNLELMTAADNCRDSALRNAGNGTGSSKISLAQREEIKQKYVQGARMSVLAFDYDISVDTVRCILGGRLHGTLACQLYLDRVSGELDNPDTGKSGKETVAKVIEMLKDGRTGREITIATGMSKSAVGRWAIKLRLEQKQAAKASKLESSFDIPSSEGGKRGVN
jgi:hypothetical protein